MEKHIQLPITRETARTIKSGESCLLSGVIYTARDAAHKRLCELLEAGKPLPFDVKDATIYYVGPTPNKPGHVIGSAGPTTSYRMDAYSPAMIEAGETGMIGKGKRGPAVVDAMKRFGAVYFAAIGGAALTTLVESALAAGSFSVDAVAGATYTSAGFNEALKDVENQAKGIEVVASTETTLTDGTYTATVPSLIDLEGLVNVGEMTLEAAAQPGEGKPREGHSHEGHHHGGHHHHE